MHLHTQGPGLAVLKVSAENGIDLSKVILRNRSGSLPVPFADYLAATALLRSAAVKNIGEKRRKRLHGGILPSSRGVPG